MDLRIFTEPQQGASYDDLLAVALTAEKAGFDAFFRSDHYLKMGSVSGQPGPSDAWVTLAGLARDTSTIRLGTLVTSATFRYPGPLAISVAGVDQMSGGRVELGLGAGWYEAEHSAYAIAFPSLGERFERLEEQLAIVTGLWSAEESFSFSGKHYQVTDSPGLPKPVQTGGVPIIIGGGGPKRTPRLAATYAAEFNTPFQSIESATQLYANVRTACETWGRDPRSIVMSAAAVVCCGETSAEIERRAKAIGRGVDDLRANGICGTPTEVVERLRQWQAAGASRVYLQVLDLLDLAHIELLGSQVLREVR
jgi:F420-dependent oxidoreductase-like protein